MSYEPKEKQVVSYTVDEAQAVVEALFVVDEAGLVKPVNSNGRGIDFSAAQRAALGVIWLQEHLRGATYRTIGEKYNVPHATVFNYVGSALSKISYPVLDEARKRDLELLDVAIQGVMPGVERGEEKAIASLSRVLDRRAKLLGLDRPLEISARVYEETAQERELRMLIEEQERENKMRESGLSDKALEVLKAADNA